MFRRLVEIKHLICGEPLSRHLNDNFAVSNEDDRQSHTCVEDLRHGAVPLDDFLLEAILVILIIAIFFRSQYIEIL